MAFQEKLPSHCVFKSHTVWSWNFLSCFKDEVQNHIAKNIFNLVIYLALITKKAPNLQYVMKWAMFQI